MKKTILLLALAGLTLSALAQRVDSIRMKDVLKDIPSRTWEKSDSGEVYSINYQMPSFKGGKAALDKFVQKNLRYPSDAEAYGVEGSVVMTFCVNRDGSVSDVSAHDCKIARFNATRFSQETEARQKELKRHFALSFAKEGARIIRKMPKWIPAKVKGETIPVKLELQLYFVDSSK